MELSTIERKEETKAVKTALAKAGIKAKVKHGTGSTFGWLFITVNTTGKRQEVIDITQLITGRRGEYDGNINVFQG